MVAFLSYSTKGSATGRRVVVACEEAVAEFEKTMLKGLTRADRTAFLRTLKSAVQNLDGGFSQRAPRD